MEEIRIFVETILNSLGVEALVGASGSSCLVGDNCHLAGLAFRLSLSEADCSSRREADK